MLYLDGFDVLHRLREDGRTQSTPVVVQTAKTQHEDYERVRRLGPMQFVEKPWEYWQLETAVQNLLLWAPRQSIAGDAAKVDRAKLWEILAKTYDKDDIRDICFILEIDYLDLRGETRRGKARELVLLCEKRGRLAELWQAALKVNPNAPMFS